MKREWWRDEKDEKRGVRMRRGRSGSPPIYRTSAPLGTETVMTPRPSRIPTVVLRGPLVAFVPCCPSRCSCSESRRSSFTARSFFGVLPRLLPSSSSVTDSGLWYQQRSWSPAPVSTVCACSSFLPDLRLLRSVSLRLFLPLPALPPSLPHPSFPRPRTLRPVVAFFWFLFPGSCWSFCRRGGKSGAAREWGEWKDGDEDEDEDERGWGWGGGALSLERSRRYVR